MASGGITLQEKMRILRRISRKYVGWRFESDELVNQMWLSPFVRGADKEYHLVRAGLNALSDYMRSEFGRFRRKPVPQRLVDEPRLEDTIDGTWMDFDSMSKGWTFTQKVIVKLRSDWFTWPEVAKLTGLSKSNARYHLAIADKEPIEKWALL